MKLKNVSHYAIYDQKFDNWKSEVLDRWTYDDFVRDPQYKKNGFPLRRWRITSRRTPYLGIGSFSAGAVEFDRKVKPSPPAATRRWASRLTPSFTARWNWMAIRCMAVLRCSMISTSSSLQRAVACKMIST
ncbi:MAG: hypothetical protein ACLR7U_06150 [Ruthenibacterium lactatiformans]